MMGCCVGVEPSRASKQCSEVVRKGKKETGDGETLESFSYAG